MKKIDLNSYLTPEVLAQIYRFRREVEAPDWPSHVYHCLMERADELLWRCLYWTDEDGNIVAKWRQD
jgi:hypothetical protein